MSFFRFKDEQDIVAYVMNTICAADKLVRIAIDGFTFMPAFPTLPYVE
jgi:hypothetical protein